MDDQISINNGDNMIMIDKIEEFKNEIEKKASKFLDIISN